MEGTRLGIAQIQHPTDLRAEIPVAAVALLMLVTITAASQEARIYVLPVLMVSTAAVFVVRPVWALSVVVLLLGFPVYVQAAGRDVGAASAFMIMAGYAALTLSGRLRPEPRLWLPATALVAVYSVGSATLTGEMMTRSLRLLLGLIAALMLMDMVLAYVRSEAALARVMASLLTLLCLQSAIALFQVYIPDLAALLTGPFAPREGVLGAISDADLYRATGTIGDYELLSEWLAVGLTLAVGMLSFPGRLSRTLPFMLLLVYLAGILATGTRGGVVAGAVGVVAFALLVARLDLGRALRLAVAMPLVTLLVVGIASALLPGLASQLASRFAEAQVDSGTLQAAGEGAFDFASLAVMLNRGFWVNLPAFFTEPHLLPYGFYPIAYSDYTNLPATSLHSLWLTIWFQGGIVGTAVWMWLAIAILRSHEGFGAGSRILGVSYGQVVALSLTAGIFAELVSESKVEFLRDPDTMGFFFMVLGLTIAASRLATTLDQDSVPVQIRDRGAL